jgi:TonB-linked SusC/RagA family outer membrane protein
MRTHRARVVVAVLTVIGTATLPCSLGAQGREAAGVVVAARSGRPIASAEVIAADGASRALVGTDGHFLLAALPRDTVQLIVRAVGYEPWRGEVRAGDMQLRITLTEVAVKLDEVVTIGTADRASRRELGNAITTIDAAEVVERGTVSSVHQLLNGRIPGLALQPSSGSVGSGARMTIRGGSSFSLPNEPLLYVDGVRVNNARSAGVINQSSNSKSISSIDDLDPADIASVEVIKGPSAATLYGTEASSGVINIITKRGTAGAARWSLTTRHGVEFIRNNGDIFPVNYQLDPAGKVISLDIVQSENARGTPIFHDGAIHEYSLNVSGGTNELRYYAAADVKASYGITSANRLSKQGGRVNLQLTPRPTLAINANAGYNGGPTREAAEGGLGGIVWSTLMADPRKLPGNGPDSTRRGFFTLLPEEFALQVQHGGKLERDVGRLTTSVSVDHAPASWFRQRLIAGYDRTDETNTGFVPRVDALGPHFALLSFPLGYKEDEAREIDYKTLDYAATVTLPLGRSLQASTSLGGQYYGTTTSYSFESGRDFPTEGLSSINSTTTKLVNDDDVVQNITIGGYVQERLAWRDRLFLTAAVRTDDNSAFGANFDRVYYPKASVSWVVSDEPFFHAPLLNTLRVRAAYGEAGKQPQAFDAIGTFATTVGPSDAAAVTPQRNGNPNLGPERGKELEIGADVGALRGRLGLELTYYDKRTTNAILERQNAPSGGFPGVQLFNAGAIQNRGVEVTARATPVRRDIFDWDLALTLATNDNKVISLGDGQPQFVTAGTSLRHQVGYPVGSWFDKRVVSAQMAADGKISQVMCDDGQGGGMPCAGPNGIVGDADDAPSVFLGRSVPRTQGSLTTTFATLANRLRLYAMLDFAEGQYKFDSNTQSRCTVEGGRCRENFFPTEFDARRIAGINSNLTLVDWMIDDASYVKLREVALAYSLPERWASRFGARATTLTISGRELHTWTRYKGLETEAMYLGGTFGGNYGGTEVNMFPQLAQWLLSINVAF